MEEKREGDYRRRLKSKNVQKPSLVTSSFKLLLNTVHNKSSPNENN
jgi:hypothetical protein